MTPDGHDIIRLVAGNLRVIREGRGLSQAVVATRMAERGWKWHQTTVGRVQAGEQPLELGEAVDLAVVLGVTLERLMAQGEEEKEAEAADAAATMLRVTWSDAVDGIRRLRQAITAAREVLPAAQGSRYPRVRQAASAIEAELAARTLDSVAAEAQAGPGKH